MSTQDIESVGVGYSSQTPDSGTPSASDHSGPSEKADMENSANQPPSIPTSATGWEVDGISPRRQALSVTVALGADAAGRWLRRHWLLLINAVLGAFVGIALLVPVLYALGADGVASAIFRAYHVACDQIPSHSYFLFGYQIALCSRNLAIYGSLLGGSLAFRYVRSWWPRLHWQIWLLTLLPMALDGGTQFFGWRESTWELRTLTGVIFGLGVCWLLLPAMEDATAFTSTRGPRAIIELPLHLPLRWLRLRRGPAVPPTQLAGV